MTGSTRPGDLAYLNGEIVPTDRARVPLLDRGYLYGEGLFETMRSYGERIFARDRHLARLRSSAAELGLEFGVGEDDLAQALQMTLAANDLKDAYLRLTVSEQCDAPGIEARSGRFSISIIARPLEMRAAPPPPVTAITLPAGSAPPAALARHKTLSFLAYICARAAARRGAVDEALLLNCAGEITEATTANVFFVIDGRLVTPSVECGVLPGITRAVVLDLARAQGIEAVERRVLPAELGMCSECFLTNSIVELQPVTRIDGTPIGAGQPGPVWSALAQAYARTVAASGA
jgi:branched-chain amino acid aminotransferase